MCAGFIFSFWWVMLQVGGRAIVRVGGCRFSRVPMSVSCNCSKVCVRNNSSLLCTASAGLPHVSWPCGWTGVCLVWWVLQSAGRDAGCCQGTSVIAAPVVISLSLSLCLCLSPRCLSSPARPRRASSSRSISWSWTWASAQGLTSFSSCPRSPSAT